MKPADRFCSQCSLVLNNEIAKNIDEKTRAVAVPGLLAALQQDPEFLKLLAKHL